MQAPIVVSVSDKECSIQAVFTADAIAKYEVEVDDDNLIPALVVLVYVSTLVMIWQKMIAIVTRSVKSISSPVSIIITIPFHHFGRLFFIFTLATTEF